MGVLFAHAVKAAQEQLGAVYVEADILATAPRLLKSAEQLGFVPVAYLPAFYCRAGSYADVVKLVKLNLPYSLDTAEFTTHAKSVVRIIDRNFEDQKTRAGHHQFAPAPLHVRRAGRWRTAKNRAAFVQKLYRPGEFVFAKGDSSGEAYIVLRGKINIQLERDAPPVAQLTEREDFWRAGFFGRFAAQRLCRGSPAEHPPGRAAVRLFRSGPARAESGNGGHAQHRHGFGRQAAPRRQHPGPRAQSGGVRKREWRMEDGKQSGTAPDAGTGSESGGTMAPRPAVETEPDTWAGGEDQDASVNDRILRWILPPRQSECLEA